VIDLSMLCVYYVVLYYIVLVNPVVFSVEKTDSFLSERGSKCNTTDGLNY